MFHSFFSAVNKYYLAILIYAWLSLTDLFLTSFSLNFLGAAEANPVMAFFFSINIISAIAFKALIIVMVALIARHLWERSTVRAVLAAGNILMTLVVAYEMVNIVSGILHS